jgi:hypothetical protein
MLTAEIKINGCPIGILSMVNTMTEQEARTIYEVEYNAIGKDKVNVNTLHTRTDGAEILVIKSMQDVVLAMIKNKKKNKKKA